MKKKHICNKCNRTFSSDYNLQKHINEKVSCDVVLRCEKCNKIFREERQLKNHFNRKNPCIKTNSIEDKLLIIKAKKESALEIIKAKTEASLQLITARKSSPPKTQINIQNNNFFIPPPSIQTHDCSIETSLIHFNNNIKNISLDAIDMRLAMCRSFRDVMIMILKLFYNNPEYPEYKNVIYIPSEDKFFSLKEMEWKETDFDELYPIFAKSLSRSMKQFGEQGFTSDCISNHYTNMISYNKVYPVNLSKRKESNNKKEVQDCAEEALET